MGDQTGGMSLLRETRLQERGGVGKLSLTQGRNNGIETKKQIPMA